MRRLKRRYKLFVSHDDGSLDWYTATYVGNYALEGIISTAAKIAWTGTPPVTLTIVKYGPADVPAEAE